MNFFEDQSGAIYVGDIEVNECVCDECGTTFIIITGDDVAQCPGCDIKFDE